MLYDLDIIVRALSSVADRADRRHAELLARSLLLEVENVRLREDLKWMERRLKAQREWRVAGSRELDDRAYTEVVMLRDEAKMTWGQIALRLGLSRRGASDRYLRAKQKTQE